MSRYTTPPGTPYPFTAFPRQQGRLAESAAIAGQSRYTTPPGTPYPFTAFPRQQGRLAESAAIAGQG
ncbi:MAG: hypothetical protein HY744_03225 [Deltaproteobacteria bacterium]|nr:hypothetical protein [Deltaproteobacteria bacterium]